MNRFATAWRMPLSLAVAYLLVLQMVLAGVALGAQAAQPAASLLDVICSSSGDHGGAPDDTGTLPSPHRDCCVQGCPMLGGLGITAPFAADLPEGSFALVLDAPAPSSDGPKRDHLQSQRTARGPPGAA